jgi:hypothetical protein
MHILCTLHVYFSYICNYMLEVCTVQPGSLYLETCNVKHVTRPYTPTWLTLDPNSSEPLPPLDPGSPND